MIIGSMRRIPHSRRRQQEQVGILSIIKESRLNWLLFFVPASIIISLLHLPQMWLFITSAIALIPLAGLVGTATEYLAARVGPGMGGFLNATFGNATELIVSLFALSKGLHVLVKASISGSIISNILLVLGTAMIAGGWKREKQTFNRTSAGASASMLFLAVVALVMPAVYDLTIFGSLKSHRVPIERLSIYVAAILIVTYTASLYFSIKTNHILFSSVPEDKEEECKLSQFNSLLLLGIAIAFTSLEAEYISDTIGVAKSALHLSEFFIGIVIIAIVGNAAEHFTAITMAAKNKMDLAVSICTSSSTQIALFVAPILIFASLLFGNPMSLVFNAFEVASIALSVLIVAMVSLDGESNWFEGIQLVAVYLVLAVVFYFVPA